MSAQAKQTIGCLVLIAVGLAMIAAGVFAGASVEWSLIDHHVGRSSWTLRSAPAILIVPALIGLGLLAVVVGAITIWLPADDKSSRE